MKVSRTSCHVVGVAVDLNQRISYQSPIVCSFHQVIAIPADDKSILIQMITWYRKAASHDPN